MVLKHLSEFQDNQEKNLSNTIPTDALQLEQTEKTNTKSKTTTKTTKQI